MWVPPWHYVNLQDDPRQVKRGFRTQHREVDLLRVESNPDAYHVKILLLLTAIQAVEEGVVGVVTVEEEEEVEEGVEVEVEVVEEVVGEVHLHHHIHRVQVLQEVEDEEVVRIVKMTCGNNWKRFCDGNK